MRAAAGVQGMLVHHDEPCRLGSRGTLDVAQRRFHYEQAFEHYLRANRIPYVAVDEAKKSLIPLGHGSGSIKSFDFVVYAADRNLLVDVKGRMYGSGARRGGGFESWVTLDDVEGLKHWRTLFGPGFEAIFVFAYCLRQQPPDALFEEVFAYGSRWYALREVPLEAYYQAMKRRSSKWRTVYIPAETFRKISRPFSGRQQMTKKAACEARPSAIS